MFYNVPTSILKRKPNPNNRIVKSNSSGMTFKLGLGKGLREWVTQILISVYFVNTDCTTSNFITNVDEHPVNMLSLLV